MGRPPGIPAQWLWTEEFAGTCAAKRGHAPATREPCQATRLQCGAWGKRASQPPAAEPFSLPCGCRNRCCRSCATDDCTGMSGSRPMSPCWRSSYGPEDHRGFRRMCSCMSLCSRCRLPGVWSLQSACPSKQRRLAGSRQGSRALPDARQIFGYQLGSGIKLR